MTYTTHVDVPRNNPISVMVRVYVTQQGIMQKRIISDVSTPDEAVEIATEHVNSIVRNSECVLTAEVVGTTEDEYRVKLRVMD